MEVILNLVIYNLITGSIYCVIALGFSLVFGVAEVLNLMHGVYCMISGYFVYTYYMVFQDMAAAVPLAILSTTAFGALSHLIIHPVLGSSFKTLIATFAVGGAVSEILFIVYGVTTYGLPNILPGGFMVMGIPVIKQAVLAAADALVVFAGFILFLNRSDMGRAMRAVAQNEDVARLCGIEVRTVKFTTIIFVAFLRPIGFVQRGKPSTLFKLPLNS